MFKSMEKINRRPKPYEFFTTHLLWNDKYVSERMLQLHLDEKQDMASRNRGFIEESLLWMKPRFGIGSETKICDFGCGPGLYTNSFAEMGADVTGVDFSERSIGHARETAEKKGLSVEYVLQNYLEFTTEKKFHLITMIFCDFCALSPEQRKAVLGKFHNFLEDDGHILLDVFSLNFLNSVEEKQVYEYSPGSGFWSPDPYYAFINTFKYEEEKLFLDKHSIFEESRSRVIYNWLQCYGKRDLEKELSSNGFQIIEMYSSVSGKKCGSDDMEIAIVAKKIR